MIKCNHSITSSASHGQKSSKTIRRFDDIWFDWFKKTLWQNKPMKKRNIDVFLYFELDYLNGNVRRELVHLRWCSLPAQEGFCCLQQHQRHFGARGVSRDFGGPRAEGTRGALHGTGGLVRRYCCSLLYISGTVRFSQNYHCWGLTKSDVLGGGPSQLGAPGKMPALPIPRCNAPVWGTSVVGCTCQHGHNDSANMFSGYMVYDVHRHSLAC